VFEMSGADAREAGERAKAALRAVEAALPGLARLTADERRTSTGRLKSGEPAAIRATLDVARAHPQFFTVLAQQDAGTDPTKFEPDVIEAQLQRIEVVSAVAAELEKLQTRLADTLLRLGELAKPVALRAYEIAKPLAAADEGVRALLSPALDTYGAPARKAARTKAARKQDKQRSDA
jgi:hypothetical protein